jgi:hypothetical protein
MNQPNQRRKVTIANLIRHLPGNVAITGTQLKPSSHREILRRERSPRSRLLTLVWGTSQSSPCIATGIKGQLNIRNHYRNQPAEVVKGARAKISQEALTVNGVTLITVIFSNKHPRWLLLTWVPRRTLTMKIEPSSSRESTKTPIGMLTWMINRRSI